MSQKMTEAQRDALKCASRMEFLFDLWKQLREWNMTTTGIPSLDEEIRVELGDWHKQPVAT